MAESREDAQAEILQGEADVDETAVAQGDEVPPSAGTASDSPLTLSSWGPPELEGYTVHGPGLDDRPRLSWTARHAGADLYFIDVRFAGEPRQSIGPLPAGDVVQHIAKREAQARRAYDEIAARFSGRAAIDLRPAAVAPAAEPAHPEPVIAAQPVLTNGPAEAEQHAPISAAAPEPIESATAAATAPSPQPPAEPFAPRLLRASSVIGAPQVIGLSWRVNSSPSEPRPPERTAATSPSEPVTSSAGAAAPDGASRPSGLDAPPPVNGAKSMLMQSIARASQLLHAPKLSLKVVRAQTMTPARPAPTADLEAGKSAGTPPPPSAAAARSQAATAKSDDLVLRDIEEILARQP